AVLPRNVVNSVAGADSFWPEGSRPLCKQLGEIKNSFLVASPGIWRVSQIDVTGKFHQRPIRVVQCRGDHVGGGILGDDLTSVECDEDSGKSEKRVHLVADDLFHQIGNDSLDRMMQQR